jgi:hypothetical protein
MHGRGVIFAVFSVFIASGCADAPEVDFVEGALAPETSATNGGWTATAHPPTYVAKGEIQGNFTFSRESGQEGRGGGGCLVANLHPGVACESNAECRTLLGAPPSGGFHYCLGVAGSPDKECWTRPTNNCLRSRDYPGGVLAPGTYSSPAVSVRVGGRMRKWMTLVCMANEGDDSGCAAGDTLPLRAVHVTSNLLGDEQ